MMRITQLVTLVKSYNMKCIATLLVLFCAWSITAARSTPGDFNEQFRLLPQPQRVEILSGAGIALTELKGISLNGLDDLRSVMTGLMGSLPLAPNGGGGIVRLALERQLNIPSMEGYVLEVSNHQVLIKGKDRAGIFYGIQTLQQLIQDASDQRIDIPAVRITDFPNIPYRAIHLDLKHHLDGMHYYYSMMDKLASIKVNAVIVEFEDKLRYTKFPEVGARNAISVEEFTMLSKYAKARNIEISPLVQGLGHASFILKHESMKDLRDDIKSDWVFDPLNSRTYDVQFSLYDDALAATPYGKYLHVGGDEVGDLGKSELARKSGKSAFDLQMTWLKKVCDYAESHGRKVIFWDDMMFKLSGLYKTTWNPSVPEAEVRDLWNKNVSKLDEGIDMFPRNCVYMRWNYEHPEIPGNMLALDWYSKHGLEVMAATSAQMMWALMPRDHSNFTPIRTYAKITAEKKLAGILCTIWDDASPHFETVWRGIYDFALSSWNDTGLTTDQAHAIFRHRHYAPETYDQSFEFQDQMEQAMPFWEKALITEGDRENYHKTFKLIPLPDLEKSGAWSIAHKQKLDDARNAVAQHIDIQNRLKKTMAASRRNQYTIDVMNQISQLQVYPANLLLLLEKLDQSDKSNKKKVSQELVAFVNEFKTLRAKFEEVYAKTRILGNPEGYQLDSNFHDHLANGTNNTDWMYMYELPMNEKIMQWLQASDSKK
jgi:hexosaminidase